MSHGELFIVSAPSGAGKTTLIRNLLDARELLDGPVPGFSVSHTTRPPRPGEVNGRHYHFVDDSTFRRMIDDDRFLEWAEVHGRLYGTSRDEVEPRLARGEDMILDIDVQGGEQVMRRHPGSHGIFVLPPSYEELRRRLVERAEDGPEQIARRLAVSLSELKCYSLYKYVIVNDDASRAGQILAAIILEKRHRVTRMQADIGRILATFESIRPQD